MANSPAAMTAPPMSAAAIALNRFGLGARADEAPPANPKNWLLAQFDAYQPMPAAWAAQPTSLAIAADLEDERQQAMANPVFITLLPTHQTPSFLSVPGTITTAPPPNISSVG